MRLNSVMMLLINGMVCPMTVASTSSSAGPDSQQQTTASATENIHLAGQQQAHKALRGAVSKASAPATPGGDSTMLKADALCYAERYPDLLQGYCHGDASRCLVDALRQHYEEHGKAAKLLWGCRSRVTEPAIPLLAMPSSQDDFHDGESDSDDKKHAPKDDIMDVHLLIFETADGHDVATTVIEQSLTAGIRTTRIGRGTTFDGFSSKWQSILAFMHTLAASEASSSSSSSSPSSRSADTLVVVADARDVLLNIHEDYLLVDGVAEFMMDHFVRAYRSLTASAPGAVVMSAEAQCCVAALTYAEPGSYFDAAGRRSQRACSSGSDGCRWGGDSKLVAWEDFQVDLAYQRTGRNVPDVFLNAGLAAGRVGDWMRLLEAVDLEPYEDDQAVFTEYMYHRPDQIVLDYASEMFGTARWPLGMNDKGCPFGAAGANKKNGPGRFPALRHLESHSMPLLLHTPGKFSACYEYITEELGLLTDRNNRLGSADNGSMMQTSNESRELKKNGNQPPNEQQHIPLAKKETNDGKNKKKQRGKKKTKTNQKTKQPKNYVVQVRALI